MACPKCGRPDTKVLESRVTENGLVIRRRRECLKCHHRFTTYERAVDLSLSVIKKSGRREVFDPRKVKMGMLKACEKRPINLSEIDRAVDEIEAELREEAPEAPTKKVGELVMAKLKAIDDVAYIRFASVYMEFDAAEKFSEVLAALSNS